uniref:Uncharacterized protein n=1 Tax=Sus scrofa TaxID=9823 RepID=A0A5G2QBI3_PIG
MAPGVPGARSQVGTGPAPQCATSALDTFTFTRGEDEGTGPGRGSAPSGLRPNPRRTWAGPLFPGPRAGRRGVTEGARRASGRGGGLDPVFHLACSESSW